MKWRARGDFRIHIRILSNPRQSGVSNTIGLRARRSAWLSYEPVIEHFFLPLILKLSA